MSITILRADHPQIRDACCRCQIQLQLLSTRTERQTTNAKPNASEKHSEFQARLLVFRHEPRAAGPSVQSDLFSFLWRSDHIVRQHTFESDRQLRKSCARRNRNPSSLFVDTFVVRQKLKQKKSNSVNSFREFAEFTLLN